MTQRIKLLSVIFIPLFLTNCQDGAGGKRIFGGSMVSQQQLSHSMTGDVFPPPSTTQQLTPEQMKELINIQKPVSVVETKVETSSPFQSIDFNSATDWATLCQNYRGSNDADGDDLPDGCELDLLKTGEARYAALEPNTPNGWLFSGVYMNKNDPRFELTPDEEAQWREDITARGGLGFINASPDTYKFIRKFSAIKLLKDSDIPASVDMFYNKSKEPIRIDFNFAAFERNKGFFIANHVDDSRLGFATGDGVESIPYHVDRPATSMAGMTGFGKDTDSYREHGAFKMVVYETNFRIPEKYTSYQMTIAKLSQTDPRVSYPPSSGMYYVMVNGESILLHNQLLNDHGRKFDGSRFGIFKRTPGCDTARIVVMYVPNGKSDSPRTAMFPEIVAFRGDKNEPWSVAGQGQYSILPQGGAACQQSFGVNEAYAPKSFFRTSTDVTRRVNGVIDLNLGTGKTASSDPTRIINAQTAKMADVQAIVNATSVSSLNINQVGELKKNLYAAAKLLNPTADEQKWIEGKMAEADNRKKQIQQSAAVDADLSTIESLAQSLPTLAAGSPEQLATMAKIDELMAKWGGNTNLTEDQKAKLADLTTKYSATKAALAAAATPPAPADPAAPVNPDTVDYTKDGELTITSPLHILLKDLDFTFTDEGQPFEAVALTKTVTVKGKKKTVEGTKNVTSAEVEQILEKLDKMLAEGKLPPEKISTVNRILEGLKGIEGVDTQAIEDLQSKYEEHLHPMAVKWAPEQLKYLTELDGDPSEVKPGITEDLKQWSKGFPDEATSAAAKKTLTEKMEKALLDPTKKDFTDEERAKAVDELAKNFPDVVDANKVEELKNKISARAAFVDANGNYHPEYAYLITLIKMPRPDGTAFSAFRFNSTIKFKKSSSEIDGNGAEIIDSLLNFVRILKENKGIPDAYYYIEAFADGVGSAKTNQALTEKRAAGVVNYIVGKGETAADHITAKGMGVHPAATKDQKGKYLEQPELRQVQITISPESFTPKVPS